MVIDAEERQARYVYRTHDRELEEKQVTEHILSHIENILLNGTQLILNSVFELEDLVVIADSGLMNKKNIALLESAGYKYIIGTIRAAVDATPSYILLNALQLIFSDNSISGFQIIG